MADAPEDNDTAPAPQSEAEWQAFYDTANEFIDVANRAVGAEPTDEVAAAFLYACARYNSFAMQAQAKDPGALGDEIVDYLAGEFVRHLREHMEEQVCPDPGDLDNSVGPPRQAIEVLKGLNDREADELSDFLDLGDRFINVANGLLRTQRISRISAAFMHACARFNVYCMQCLGHPPGEVEEDLVEEFRKAYVALVNYHLQETLVRSQS